MKKGKEIKKDFSMSSNFYEENNTDTANFEITMGINTNKNVINKENYIDDWHILLSWPVWTWKTNIILNVLYQLHNNPFTEFYIIDKWDLSDFMNLYNVTYYSNIADVTDKTMYTLLKILYSEMLRRKNIFAKYEVKTYKEYIKKYNSGGSSFWMPKLTYITAIFEEYQTIREKISKAGKLKKFDEYISHLVDICKFSGIKFIISSFSVLTNDIWSLSIQWTYISLMDKKIEKEDRKDYSFSYNGTDKIITFPNLSTEIKDLIDRPVNILQKIDLLELYKIKTINIIDENFDNGFF